MLVALLVVAVMVAFAIPLYQGFQDNARDRAVQSHVRDGLTLERAHWQDTGAFTSLPASLETYDPSALFFASPGQENRPMLILDPTSSGQRVCIAALSESGTWFGVYDDSTAGETYYGEGLPLPCNNTLTTIYGTGGW